jgi:hypothetical protein
MQISWVQPELEARVRQALIAGRRSWEETLVNEVVVVVEPLADVDAGQWPVLAEHVARAERVRESVAQVGLAAAAHRFGDSPHAVERAALAQALAASAAGGLDELTLVRGVLSCAIDERVAYGHFQARLVELAVTADPSGTVAAIERFVAAATDYPAQDPSWRERTRAAQDGLASLYARVGRHGDAEGLWTRRFDEDPHDTTVAISAARAFLEASAVARAVAWLERGAGRARTAGRGDLAERLASKAGALRRRLS